MLHGFDISGYQSKNWDRSCDFLFVKATEGKSYKNDNFSGQWATAKAKKFRGAYHFARPEQSSGTAQADFFLSVVKPVAGDLLVLDLEASKLNQADTHKFAVDFANRCKEKFPDNKRVVYMGSGYASNNTGKGLKDYYHFWWYPQYPSTANTSTWKTSVTPWLPSGLTCGWSKPHIWQFTDNFGGLDANVTSLTVADVHGTDTPVPTPPKPVTPSVPSGDPELKLGSKGSRVKALQEALNKALGLHLVTDGDFGSHTQDAVDALQKRAKITRDGVYGKASASALKKLLAG